MQNMKHFIHGGVGIILLAVWCTSAAAQTTQEQQLGRAGEWLSWTPVQRTAYVYGLVDGYLMGFLRACNLTDRLFDKGKPHRLGDAHHPTDMPSGRCLAHRGEFSEIRLDKEGHRCQPLYRCRHGVLQGPSQLSRLPICFSIAGAQ